MSSASTSRTPAWPGGLVLLAEGAAASPELLAPAERAVLERFEAEKRRADWLRGRLAARAAVEALLGGCPDGLAILADPSGAPLVHGAPGVVVSLSHGHGRAAAWALRDGLPGVDLEKVRPRPPGTLRFYLSPEEREWVATFEGSADPQLPAGETSRRFDRDGPPSPRDRAAVVLWALKEAAFKALRPPRGLGLLDVSVALEGSLEAGGGAARIGWRGGLVGRAAALGATGVEAGWALDGGDLAVAWVRVRGASDRPG